MPIQSSGNASISQMRDGLIDPGFTSPTYASTSSFTVVGDVTSWLRPGREVVLNFHLFVYILLTVNFLVSLILYLY